MNNKQLDKQKYSRVSKTSSLFKTPSSAKPDITNKNTINTKPTILNKTTINTNNTKNINTKPAKNAKNINTKTDNNTKNKNTKNELLLKNITKISKMTPKINTTKSKNITNNVTNKIKPKPSKNTTSFYNYSNLSVVLVRPSISGNIGAIARSMANFGTFNLILVDPKCVIDDEARNRAKHAQIILNSALRVNSLQDILKTHGSLIATTGILGSDYNISRIPLMPEELAIKLSSINGKIALVFGPEDTGLSNDELELCDMTVNIPTNNNYPVMNLSHAVTIILYEISKNTNSAQITKKYPLVTGKEKEILDTELNLVINSVNYRTPFEKRTQLLVWRRIIGKSTPTRREAFAMIGLLKKLSKKKKK